MRSGAMLLILGLLPLLSAAAYPPEGHMQLTSSSFGPQATALIGSKSAAAD